MKCNFSKQYSFLKEIGQTPNTQILLVKKRKPKNKHPNSAKNQSNFDDSGTIPF